VVFLKNRIYLNKQVSEIVGITQRQVLSWSEKGLIIPYEESKGAGKKRGYDYTNLLEFGLCKTLFSWGIGFRAVKGILNELKKGDIIRDWANNFEQYYDEIFKGQLSALNKTIEEFEAKGDINRVECSKEFKKKFIQTPIHPDKPVGVLVYFMSEEKDHLFIIPWDMGFAINLNIIKNGLIEHDGCFLVDLGKIKGNIDIKV
jgi:DNA-binding transcriptional MerR regulator